MIAAADSAGCTRRTCQIARNVERRSEHSSRQIADRVFATELDIHQPVNEQPLAVSEIPQVKNGLAAPTVIAMQGLLLDVQENNPPVPDGFVAARASGKNIQVNNVDPGRLLNAGLMPDLTGMSGADVLYLLENRGYRVKLRGSGAVTKQSVAAGQKISKGTEVLIELSL